MRKMVLVFSSRERMAEFVLECKIVHVHTDPVACTLTGSFSEDCIEMAVNHYGAHIANPPDFIMP
jgi:hypothetical protein